MYFSKLDYRVLKNLTGDFMKDVLKRGLFISSNSLSNTVGMAIIYD